MMVKEWQPASAGRLQHADRRPALPVRCLCYLYAML